MIDASALGTAVWAFVIICTVAVCVAGEIISAGWLRDRERVLWLTVRPGLPPR
jgi:hypothetical protein